VIRDELRESLKEVIWGASPVHTYYSGSSAGMIQDFLWYTPVAMQHESGLENGLNTQESFIDRRSASRMEFVNLAEDTISQFLDICHEAASMHPPINSTILFELEHALGSNKNPAAAAFNKGISGQRSVRNSPTNKYTYQGGLLEEFLQLLDRAATDFSHVSYGAAMTSLANANTRIWKLEQRMVDILNTRSGSLKCASSEGLYSDAGAGTSSSSNVGGEVPRGRASMAWIRSIFIQFALIGTFVFGGIALGHKLRAMMDKRRKQYL
jgi:hypothetical protein